VVAVQEGDVVSVTIDNGTATVDGNASRPSTDDGAAQEARVIADKAAEDVASIAGELPKVRNAASSIAQTAQGIAAEAQAIAAAVNQHFFADGQGVHVTEAAGDATTEHNVLINSLGFLLRKATAPLMALSASTVAFYDGLGDAAANIVARFGKDGSQIGKDGESHVELDYHSMKLVDKEGNEYFLVSDLRDADGVAEIVAMFTGDGTTRSFNLSPTAIDTDYTVTVSDSSGGTVTKNTRFVSFGTAPTDGATITVTYETDSQMAKAFTYGSRGTGNVGALSFAAGRNVVASESFSHAEGEHTMASGRYSHAEGTDTGARGDGSHAEGGGSSASGSCAHAEGNLTIASAANSHAEGGSSYATGLSAHAEGNHSVASGDMSHAEGDNTVASGRASHAQGEETIAASDSQTVLGRYNVEDANGAYALVIGNGTAYDARSNALTVDWSGNVWAAGKATLDGAIEAASATITSAISAASATISGLLTADRVKIASGGTKGLLTTDSTGFEYPLISDNGNNLWIGAHKAGEQHHTGGTFISAGAGRDTIYVSVPNSDNTAGTNYSVMHSGYAPVETSTISDIISAQTNVTVSAATFAQWGKVAMLNVTYTLSSEISVPANGNTTNTALFTIAAGKRPAMVLGVILDNNEGAWGTVNANGVVTLAGANSRGAAWTMNTTNNRYLQICYLLP